MSVGPKTLSDLNAIIAASEPLVPGAARAVLGEGPVGAAIAFVGEQPGDVEDQEGKPFVGPAGKLLERAMSEAGIERKASYLTNAVKHFKYEQRGKRRIHQKPTAGEVKHYRWWLCESYSWCNLGSSSRSAPRRCWRSREPLLRFCALAVPQTSMAIGVSLPCIRLTCCVCPGRARKFTLSRISLPTCNPRALSHLRQLLMDDAADRRQPRKVSMLRKSGSA